MLHQVSWAAKGIPVWSRSRVENPAAGTVTVPSCVGLVPKVAAFALDPFPDELPNQLVKLADTASPDEQVSFYTQDITSARWSRDKVRLPSTGDPQKVTHYVSSVTVLDRRGTAMPLLPVKVSAETLAEIQVDGASYLVGPGHSASLATNAFGRITIATPADSLLPATLNVDAVGLRNGAVIQPAAVVHDYLGGTGTLPSQQGLFDEEALKKAKIVEPGHADSIHAVVTHSKQVFALADGKPLVSHLFTGAGPAPGIRGFVVGPTPGAHLGQRPHPVVYREFDTPEAPAGCSWRRWKRRWMPTWPVSGMSGAGGWLCVTVHAQPRTVMTAAGAVQVTAPRVSDKRVDPVTGERRRSSSAILPPWCGKSPKIAEVLPLLYLLVLIGVRADGRKELIYRS